MAELVVVIVPMVLILMNALEFSRFSQCKMVLKHAAVVAARSCAVTRGTLNPGFTGKPDDYKLAARQTLLPWRNSGRLNVSEVTCDEPADPKDEHGLLTARLKASYKCLSPLSFCFAMRGSASRVPLRAEASFPRQGAKYDVHYQ